jgi:hypothetical protein
MYNLFVCLFPSIVTPSKAKDNIVVNVPQNPIAIKNEYFESRFKKEDNTEKTPRIKLPVYCNQNI